ncbi:hypothetical protein V6N12_042956 [Hibiscus sabdariffa]|uniref:Uncharacterized protein n=1 Tax=Hibiscus sabdariffa TaxID=183260 RepID=A0ABR2DHU3_9ROSI
MKQDKLKDRQSQAQFIVTGRHALIKAQEAQSSKDEERTRTGTSKQNYIYYIAAGGRTAQKRERSGTGKSARATLREASSSFYFEGARNESSLGPSEGLDVTSSLFCFLDGPRVKADPEWSNWGNAEATRVGLVRYDIKRPHAGALFTALYLKQCAVTLQQAYGGITPDDKADMLVKLYLSFFSLSRAIKLAKRISPSLFASITDPMSDVQKFAEVRDWLRGLIRKLANQYLSQALSRPREYRGNRLGRLCQRIVSDLPCISIRNDVEAYIERISSLIYGHPLPDILVMNGMPLGEEPHPVSPGIPTSAPACSTTYAITAQSLTGELKWIAVGRIATDESQTIHLTSI